MDYFKDTNLILGMFLQSIIKPQLPLRRYAPVLAVRSYGRMILGEILVRCAVPSRLRWFTYNPIYGIYNPIYNQL